MTDFHYSALDRDGHAVTGVIESDDRAAAISSLAGQGVFITDIHTGAAPAQPSEAAPWWRRSGPRRVRVRDRAAMLRQLATALQAGLPLLEALRVVQQQAEHGALAVLAGDLADRVQAGESLSAAMDAHPSEFSRLETSMTRVGETAGLLDQVMGYLADFADRDLEVREQIRSAAAYPIFVLALGLVSVVIVLTVILPRVLHSLGDTMVVMPWPTVVMMGVSDFLRAYWWLVVGAIAGGVWAFRAWLSRPAGRLAFDRFKLRVPVVGTALRRVAVARFARTLGTLSKAGIPILEALHVLRDTLGNEALGQEIDRVSAGITQGRSIAEPLRQTGQFPPLLIQVIAMGERTGRLDELLLQTAGAYERETTAAIGRVMTLLPAVFIVLLALLVLFILASVLLPIVSMETSLPGL
jgi:general secretion pathway protein F